MDMKLRPPAVPLVTIDPYLSVWSMTDNLYDDTTRHWTGKRQGMTGIVMIDGKAYIFMGKLLTSKRSQEACLVLKQTNVEVKALSSVYTFEGGGIELEADFTSPLLMDDLDVLSRPASYITFKVKSIDGREHDIKIYFDVTGEWCVNTPDQNVTWGRKKLTDGSEAMYMGTDTQAVLNSAGDDVRIDWGYMYLVFPGSVKAATVIHSWDLRRDFIIGGSLPERDDDLMPRAVEEKMPIMAGIIDLPLIGPKQVSTYLVVAYDDIYSVEYFGKPVPGYWKRNGLGFDDILVKAVSEYQEIKQKCDSFNKELKADGIKSGGEKYAAMLNLAYRQAIAAHKLVADENGKIMFFSKECFSNGCMGTVDVSYPSIPLFLIYNPELVKGMMRFIFTYSKMPGWPFEFAPHDMGRYPKANGQVYGVNKNFEEDTRELLMGKFLIEKQMPVEECGNMLIMAAAVCLAEKKADFALENWELLTKWAAYLKKYGMDPGNQLCTDDFAGHLAHNTNLSIKAILGIASYAVLCGMAGNTADGEIYMSAAKLMAVKWEKAANEGDHYRLTFDAAGTWSQKYNLVWDHLFGLEIFPYEVTRKEIEFYIKTQNQYGLALDSRDSYTKTDWIFWSAAMAECQDDFEKMIAPVFDSLNDTTCRVPFTDWYYTVNAQQARCMCHEGKRGFRNRSVIGGIFIKLLKDRQLLK